MKAILGAMILMGLAVVVFYFAGGYASFDPAEQGRQAKAAVTPGMSFSQACAITGDPDEFQIISPHTERVLGKEIVVMRPAVPVETSRERINQLLADGGLAHGFLCTFQYSADTAFTVEYDPTGAVLSVSDAATVADLLNR